MKPWKAHPPSRLFGQSESSKLYCAFGWCFRSEGVFTHTDEWGTLLYAFFTHVDEEQIGGKRRVSEHWAGPLFSSPHLQIYKVNRRRRICVKLIKELIKTKFIPRGGISAFSPKLEASRGKMTAAMEKSKNFCIDALLAHGAEQRADGDGASSGRYCRSPGGRPVSLNPKAANSSSTPQDVLYKSQRSHLSQSGIPALHHGGLLGMHPGSVYPLAALGGQTQGFVYPGFAQLLQPYPEQLKSATMAAGLPLEHWIRAGMMIPRVGEYGGKRLTCRLLCKNSYFYQFSYQYA